MLETALSTPAGSLVLLLKQLTEKVFSTPKKKVKGNFNSGVFEKETPEI